MIYLIYHRMDLDGHCSLAIAMRYYGPELINKKYKVFGYHYGDPIDFTQFKDATRFIFMDVFPQPYHDMYMKFKAICPDITVLDHHKTFIESSVKDEEIKGIQTTEYSGCELTWMWFNLGLIIPEFVKLLGEYDRWDNSNIYRWDEYILPFQYGAKSYLQDPSVNYLPWSILFENSDTPLESIKANGRTIIKEHDRRNAKVMENNAFEATFDGLRVLACNDGMYNSQLFSSMWNETKYDAMLAFSVRSDGMISVSLYATDDAIDCTPVAKKHGGGGHAHACGFKIEPSEFFALLNRAI